MRIKAFSYFVESNELTTFALQDNTVVVDGQNFFYSTYEQSGLPTDFGIEGDRYAHHLRQYLSMFKKANVKCYFLFKGGHENVGKRLTYNNPSWSTVPTFMKEIYKEILDEMNFEYAVCEYESKKDVIEMAQKLDCPVISRDIEFCFSGLKYIPSTTLKFNERDNSINCGYFLLADFLKKHNLTVEKMSVFIALRNERNIPEETFIQYFTHLKAPPVPYNRNLHLMKYLSLHSEETVLTTIFKFVSFQAEDKQIFIEEQNKARQMIGRRENGGFGAACLMEEGAMQVSSVDPCWFAKGVASGNIHINYINLYRSQVFYGAGPIPGFDNPILLSLDIIYYAYDLLTDFKNSGFTLLYETNLTDEDKKSMEVVRSHSIPKPVYDAEECVFENGWVSLQSLGLLEHFARSTLQLESLRCLERAPQPARLLLLALAYFTRRRPSAPVALPQAILLSYVILEAVDDKSDDNSNRRCSSVMDKLITSCERRITAAVMKDYFEVLPIDVKLLDRKLLHALAEFQQCLLQLSALNALCGEELPPLVFSRTYNGTLTYKLLFAMNLTPDFTGKHFLYNLLNPVPTVNDFFKSILEVYLADVCTVTGS